MSAAGLAMATRDRLLALYETAVAAAHPSACLQAHLPAVPDSGRLVVGAGKAAAAIAVRLPRRLRRWPCRPRRPAARSRLSAAGSSRSACATSRAAAGCQEYALALALVLDHAPGISALTADTASTAARASQPMRPAPPSMRRCLAGVRHLDAKNFLHNNDATSFFEAAGGLIVRGPTHTNVNDFRVILVDA